MNRIAFLGAAAAAPVAAAAGVPGGTHLVERSQDFDAQRFAQVLGRTADVRQVYSWLFGSFAGADWSLVRLALPYAVISVLIVTVHARHLDVLALGDDEAATLGLQPVRTRLIVLSAASLATATAVAVSGIIGFVGLVVPHIVRRAAGPGHRLLLPMSLLVGGAFLVLADLLARTALAPAELPIGVVTSFVGAPFFLVILRATRERDR